MKIRNLQSLLVCPIILWKSSLTRFEWISGWRSWLASRIQKLCLVFGVHSLHAVMCVPTRWKSTDWILADKVLKKTPVDLQKRFPIYHACPKCLAAYRCGSAFPQNGLAFRHDLEKVGVTPVDWERGIVHCVLIRILKFSRIIQTTSFCSSGILAVSSRIVSWFSINLLLENSSNVDPWDRFNSPSH